MDSSSSLMGLTLLTLANLLRTLRRKEDLM